MMEFQRTTLLRKNIVRHNVEDGCVLQSESLL